MIGVGEVWSGQGTSDEEGRKRATCRAGHGEIPIRDMGLSEGWDWEEMGRLMGVMDGIATSKAA